MQGADCSKVEPKGSPPASEAMIPLTYPPIGIAGVWRLIMRQEAQIWMLCGSVHSFASAFGLKDAVKK